MSGKMVRLQPFSRWPREQNFKYAKDLRPGGSAADA
jgi:hypothetical protein